jgi:hypothetical protein
MFTASASGSPKTSLQPQQTVLSEHSFSMSNRYKVESINQIFKKNILLNLAYLEGSVNSREDINWDKIESPTQTSFTLEPGETFAYHGDTLAKYTNVKVTTNANFNASDGFLSDGYLFGDGVCQFASLINWVAQDSGLEVFVPKNHDFAVIPDVPKEYGVSIYVDPSSKGSGANNNLYITNNTNRQIRFHFEYTNGVLRVYTTVQV